MTLGEKLSKLRKEYNYTQEQLADILGVSRQSISKWESDIAYPETDKLVKMGKLFECSMDYLLNEDISEKQGIQPTEKESLWDKLKLQRHMQLIVEFLFIGKFIISPYRNKSRRSLVYHQFRRNCISSTRSVASHQAAGGLCTAMP